MPQEYAFVHLYSFLGMFSPPIHFFLFSCFKFIISKKFSIVSENLDLKGEGLIPAMAPSVYFITGTIHSCFTFFQ